MHIILSVFTLFLAGGAKARALGVGRFWFGTMRRAVR